jgi:hypothetical protein
MYLIYKGVVPMSSSQESPAPKITRREALKVLAAATGAVVLSNLPQEWKTPIVEVGVLPAHAQGASGPAPQIFNMSGFWDTANMGTSVRGVTINPICNVNAVFNYSDALGQVSNSTTVNGTYANQTFGPLTFIHCGSSTAYCGTGQVIFNSSTCFTNQSSLLRMSLLVNGRYSNVANCTISQIV